MSKIKWWFLGFLLVMAGSSVSTLCAEEPLPGVVPSGEIVSPASEETTPGIDNAVRMAQEEVRDPFSRAPEPETLVIASGPEIGLELQGIGLGSKGAYAVIGGNIFFQGDEHKGIKLLEVRRGEVDILKDGGRITLYLFPAEDLQRAKDRAKKNNATKDASRERKPETPLS